MADVNMCLAENGGTLGTGANENDRNYWNEAHYISVNPGSSSFTAQIDFPSCTVSKALWLVAGTGSGASTSRNYYLYLNIDGSWTQVKTHSDSGIGTWYYDWPDGETVTGPWEKVTGIKYYVTVYSPIGVSRGYGYGLQAWGSAIIGGFAFIL